jgi:hypothetical protein
MATPSVIPVIQIDPLMLPALRDEVDRLEARAIRELGSEASVERRAVIVRAHMSATLRRYLADRRLRRAARQWATGLAEGERAGPL